MPWIQHPLRLEGALVRLEPMLEAHFDALVAAGSSPDIWKELPLDGSDAAALRRELGNALLQRAAGHHYPFTIFDAPQGSVIGSTRFFELAPEHKKLEIGWTWYTPEAWGRGHNPECKLLLLQYCFEQLGVQRVQLKTRATNKRSAAAIQKIGGIYEGTLRKDRIMPNGEVRDTMVFSIIDEEWPAVKERLIGLIG